MFLVVVNKRCAFIYIFFLNFRNSTCSSLSCHSSCACGDKYPKIDSKLSRWTDTTTVNQKSRLWSSYCYIITVVMAHRFDSWRSSVERSANTLDSGRGKNLSLSSLETRSGKTNTVIHIDVETILRWRTEKYTVSQRLSSFVVLAEEMARHNSIRRRPFASMVSYNNMIKGNIICIHMLRCYSL